MATSVLIESFFNGSSISKMTLNAFGSVGSWRPRSTRSSASLDEGCVRLEEISRLQGTILAYKGHLTRRYNDIRSLFANDATVTEIMIKRNCLDEIFTRYSSAVESLLHILA